MTKFHQGPADGRTLMIRRAPRFLRVVQDNGGAVDALDQIDDTPKPTEAISVYEIEGEPGYCHLNRRGGQGGVYPIATYRLFPNQPEDAEVRTTEAWQRWCQGIVLQLEA